MKADLHCHTKTSDGSLGTDELIGLAKRAGLEAIAITDHDTFAGVTKAKIAGDRAGVRVIPGIEVSAWDYSRKRKVHVLGYLCDEPEVLGEICRVTAKGRQKAALLMLQKVIRIYPITPEMVAKRAQGSTNIYKQHIMHALVEGGFCAEVYGDLYRKLFDPENGIAFFPVEYPDVRDVVEKIRAAGGVVVLAHPYEYDSIDLMEELTEEHLLDGIEAYHSRNQLDDSMRLSAYAHDHQLLMTGGSDFHGMYSSRPIRLGSCTTPEQCLKELLAFKRQKAKNI